MIVLWILAAALSAAAAALVLARAARAGRETGAAEAPEREVYRRQLAEIDELAARGLLSEPELGAARAEAGRRLLAADGEAAPLRPGGRRTVIAAAILAPLAAVGLYLALGSPGLPDQPFADRLAGWRRQAKADPMQLSPGEAAALLTQAAKEDPGDATPLLLLADVQARTGQQGRVLLTLREAVRRQPKRAEAWTMLGQAEAAAAQGQVTAQARAAFARAAALDPTAPEPAYFLARARIEDGDAAGGLAAWRALQGRMAPGSEQRAFLAREIAAVERTGRLAGAPRPAPAAGAADQQRAFIQAMVDRLSARLSASPDDPAGWARLIRSYGVLGQDDRRRKAIETVRRRYAARPELLDAILAGDENAARKAAE